MNRILVRIAAFPVVTTPFGAVFRPLPHDLGRRPPKQIFQPPHVVNQVHQADLDCSPHLTFGAYPKPSAGHHVLMAEDMFYPGAGSGTGPVGLLFLFVQLPVSVPFVMNPTRVSLFLELRFSFLRAVGRVGPYGATTVLLVEQFVEHLAVVDRRIGHRITPDQLVFLVDVDVILVAVVALAMLLGPAGIEVFLAFLVRLVFPRFGYLALLDLLVLLAPVSISRHVHQAGIDDLTAFGQKAGLPQLPIKSIEQLFHQPMTGQLLPEQPEGLGIRYAILRCKPQKTLERQAIPHLKLGLVVRKVVQGLQHQHLEHPHRIPGLAACMAFAGLLVDFLQQRLEGIPVHDPVQSRQRIPQLFQFSKSVFLVEEARLHGALRMVSTGSVNSNGSMYF